MKKLLFFVSFFICVSSFAQVFSPFQDTIRSCGNSLTLDAGAGYNNYVWSNGATSQQITVSQSGNYQVSVQQGVSSTNNSYFDLTGRYFFLPYAPQLNFGNQMTILLKTRIVGPIPLGTPTLIDQMNSNGMRLTLDGTSTKLNFRYNGVDNGVGVSYTLSPQQVQNANWFYIAIKKTTDSLFFIVNGQIVDQISCVNPIPNIGAPIYFGGSGGSFSNYRGSIDNVSLWNRGLTISEISRFGSCMDGLESGCVGYYTFEWPNSLQDFSIYDNFAQHNSSNFIYTYPASEIINCSISTLTDSTYIELTNANITQNDTTICSGASITLNATVASTSGVTDVDGNYYPSVNIGNQTWMQKNLNVSHYRNGDPIPQVTNASQWASLTSGAWCWYNNDSATYAATYGKLYNWYAVNDPRGLAPNSWRIPNESDWNSMVVYLDPSADTICQTSCYPSQMAGGLLKSTNIWSLPNTGATNSSGFTALPGGYQSDVGTFQLIGQFGIWWSKGEYNSEFSWNRSVDYSNRYVGSTVTKKTHGFSIRCIKGNSSIVSNPTYLWSTGATTPTISVSPTTSTTYYCTITDGNGATCTDSVRITVNNCNTACLPSYLPTNGLVGYWPFCGNANDESGNGNNGTVNGATLTTDRFGEAGKAYSFDGVSNYIEVPSSQSISVSSSYTLSAWFNATQWSFNAPIDQHAIISKVEDGAWYGGYEIYIGGAESRIFHIGNIGNNFSIGSNGNSINTWYNVIVSFDGSVVKYYLNGIAHDSVLITGQLQTSAVPLRFGRRGGAGIYNNWFNGSLDDIAIYNRALSAQEIAALYAASAPSTSCTATITPSDTAICRGSLVSLTASTTSTGGATGALPTNLQTGLVGYWPFNGNANDESGNGNNGTVNGATLTTDRFGNAGKAYGFDGVNDYIKILNAANLNSQSITITGWINATSLSPSSIKGLVSRWDQGAICPNYSVSIDSYDKITGASTNYTGGLFSTLPIQIGNWYQFAYTHDLSNGGIVYLNGTIVASNSVAGAICNSINDLYFGAQNNSAGNLWRFFSGSLDDIAIWNRALTASEIQQLYNSQSQTTNYLWSTGDTTATISVSPANSTTYYCTITDGNGNTCTDSVRVTVNTTIPPTPRGISGLINVCAAIGADTASAPVTYTVIPVAGAIGYTWTLPANCTLLSGQGTDTIRVRFSSSYTQGIISVKAINGCGVSSVPRGLTVTKRQAAQPGNIYKQFVPVAIPAVTAICNTSSEVYRIVRVNFASSFIWSLRNGTGTTLTHLGTPGINDTAVNIAFTTAFQYDTLSVRAVTACNVSPERFIILNRSAQTAAIRDITATNNNFTPCIGDSISYTAVPNPVAINQSAIAVYRWVLPAGLQVLSATTDSQRITLRFLSTFNGGLLSVKGASSCGGLGAGKSYYFRYWAPIPVVTSGTGSLNACPGDAITYTASYTNPLPTSQRPPSVYLWTLPTGASISSANSDSSVVTIQYGTAFRGGSLIIRSQTNCGVQSIDRRLTITNTGCVYCNANITTADTTICAGDSVTLTATVTGNAQQGSGLSGTLLNGLVGYYPFNGNANDESGNGNNGTVNGATLTTDRFGNAGKAYGFDGNNNFISVPNIAATGNQSRSFSAWVNFYNINNSGLSDNFISTGQASQSAAFNFRLYFRKLDIMGYNNDYWDTACVDLSNSSWYHCIVTYNGTNLNFYLNGQYQGTNQVAIPFNTSGQNNFFGKSNHTGWEYYLNGKLDDIAIYNRALTVQEVQQLYNSQSPITNYQWSNGATTPSIRVSPAQATTYTCTITSNGATCTDSVTVSVNTNCATSCIADIVNNDTTICAGQPVTLTATTTATGGSGLGGTLQNGLVGYWPFNGNANDESGNGNNGTVNGATLTTDRFGNAGKAYSFDGVTNKISFNLNSINNIFPSNTTSTTSVWVKTFDSNGPLVSMQGNNGFEYVFHIGTLADVVQSSGNYGILVRDNCCGTGNNIFGGNSNDGLWHMLTVVRTSDGTLKLYKDAVLEATSGAGQSGALIFNQNYMTFGADQSWIDGQNGGCTSCNTVDQQYLNGKLDDIAIWNRALTPQEVQQLYSGTTTNGVTDIDGNNYPTVNIGTQTWTQKNLNVSRYRNGDVIPQVTDPIQWINTHTGAWCWFNNDSATYAATYGKLYNWYAVNDPRGLAQQGWHVPNDAEWNVFVSGIDPGANLLCNGCNQSMIAAKFIKDTSVIYWNNPTPTINDSTRFKALPAGYRANAGVFQRIGASANWWTSSEVATDAANQRAIRIEDNSFFYGSNSKSDALSVRLIKDNFYNPVQQIPNYQWSTGATTATITVNPTQTTTYYCTVSYGNVSCVDSVTVTVNANALSAPLAINGAEDICPLLGNDTATAAVPYTCTSVTGAATYNWTMPAGATLLSGQGTTAITVRFSSSYTGGNISVVASNSCAGNSEPRLLYVAKLIAATPVSFVTSYIPPVAAVTNVCNINSQQYMTRTVRYATGYLWSMSNGGLASITHINPAGVNDTAVIVNFASGFVSDTLNVRALTACSVSEPRQLGLLINQPTAYVVAIANAGGNFSPCIGDVISYSATASSPQVGQSPIAVFRWTLAPGAVIINANADSSNISVSFTSAFNGGVISVRGQSACGGLGTPKTVYFRYYPPTPSSITSSTGSFNACNGNQVSYTVLLGAIYASQRAPSVYRWTLPAGASIIVANADSSTITVQFNTGYRGGSMSVRGVTPCGVVGNPKTQGLTNTGCRNSSDGLPYTKTSTVLPSGMQVILNPNPTVDVFRLRVNSGSSLPITVTVSDSRLRLLKRFEVKPGTTTSFGNDLIPGVYMIEVMQGEERKVIRGVRM